MIVLGFDTATRATAVALMLDGREPLRALDDPPGGEHPGHATRLLAMADRLLATGGSRWGDIGRIAVGLGPGTFTGLRVGVATARGLAQSLDAELVGVSSSLALATTALERGAGANEAGEPSWVLAVTDARRGEVFAGVYRPALAGGVEELVAPRPIPPDDIGSVIALADEHGAAAGSWAALGDGAVRYRSQVEALGVMIPEDSSPLHRVDAGRICALGARGRPTVAPEMVLPDYRRRPDAELTLEAVAAREGGA